MDAISDRAFSDSASSTAQNIHKVIDETPSLLSVILDVHPLEWKKYIEKHEGVKFRHVTSAILVMLNSHLALNSDNKVSVYIANSFHHGAKCIYPQIEYEENDTSSYTKSNRVKVKKEKKENDAEGEGEGDDEDEDDDEKILSKPINKNKRTSLLKGKGIYGQFKVLDENILNALDDIYNAEPERLRDIINKDNNFIKGTMTGAISTALTAINKLQHSEETMNIKARVMIVSVSGDNTLPYVSMMNTIFAAQKMKVSLDVCKLGEKSIFLQQTSDATNGVYIDIKHPSGIIQYLSSALFIEPLLRPIVVLPTNTSVDFRASCFVSNAVVDIGYVCSVCLCILSMVPADEKCPTCYSKFEHKLISRMKRKPKVLPLDVKKKKKVEPKSTKS